MLMKVLKWVLNVFLGWSKHLSLIPLKYFLHNAIWAQFGLGAMVFQINLAPIARFWALRSLKFNPPSKIGFVIVSQLIRENILSFFLAPFQKKCLINFSIFFMIPTGARRIENLKITRLLRTALMSTALLVMLSQEDPHACIFSLNLSSWGDQSFLDALLLKIRRPRYLNEDQEVEAVNLRHLAMDFVVEAGMFQQYILHLPLFNMMPEIL